MTQQVTWTQERSRFVLDLAMAFECVSLPCVCAWATHIKISQEDVAGAVWVLRASEAHSV